MRGATTTRTKSTAWSRPNCELAGQRELAAAITPVEDRLLKKYRAAQKRFKVANERTDGAAAKVAKDK